MSAAAPATAVERVPVPTTLDGERLDRVLCLIWDLARSEATDLIASGAVHLGGRIEKTRARRVVGGQELTVALPPRGGPVALTGETGTDVAVVFADDQVIVVDKPAGLVVHPGAGRTTGTLAQALLGRFPDMAGVGSPERPGIVHRLDKGTSGLLVVARTPAAYTSLVEQLSTRSVDRRYVALLVGTVETDAGVVDAPVGRRSADRTRMAVTAGGRPSRTHYRVLGRYTDPEAATLVACRLETGRTHQVRVHMSAIGHPVAGDVRYGDTRSSLPATRPFLHAAELAFDHPGTGERCRFESPLPTDLETVLASLR
ncbi:MAG TPA: RluA family pseudouridine synthase [Acidimicrobiales bacterium]|nr:RluA family pseudouridine synthase [Acidimicrobiales bacterium]